MLWRKVLMALLGALIVTVFSAASALAVGAPANSPGFDNM